MANDHPRHPRRPCEVTTCAAMGRDRWLDMPRSPVTDDCRPMPAPRLSITINALLTSDHVAGTVRRIIHARRSARAVCGFYRRSARNASPGYHLAHPRFFRFHALFGQGPAPMRGVAACNRRPRPCWRWSPQLQVPTNCSSCSPCGPTRHRPSLLDCAHVILACPAARGDGAAIVELWPAGRRSNRLFAIPPPPTPCAYFRPGHAIPCGSAAGARCAWPTRPRHSARPGTRRATAARAHARRHWSTMPRRRLYSACRRW